MGAPATAGTGEDYNEKDIEIHYCGDTAIPRDSGVLWGSQSRGVRQRHSGQIYCPWLHLLDRRHDVRKFHPDIE
jgi:hypothetical protein